MKKIIQVIIFINYIVAQGWHNHPELEWETIETEHFFIHFHIETKRSAKESAAIAEKIYKPITSFYNYEPDTKTHLIIKDVDDISNGAAYYYDNKIIIWALPLDFDLRGSHRWLNNVITHEFTHIVQIGAAMKYPRRFPASFIQFLNYETEKREDVLYGYPNVLMSYPIPGVSVPPWLAEGTAQYMYPGANFDFWDSHRDMIVRDRILNKNLLSFESMNTFGKRGIGNESAYNQGFLFCSWLVDKFGLKVLKDITESISKPINYSINHAISEATGSSGTKLYKEWKDELHLVYLDKTKNVVQNEQKGKILIDGGTSNIHPVWSPDEMRFAYLSNKNYDFFGQNDLFIFNFSDSLSNKIAEGVHTAPTWVNDSTIIYTKRSKPNKWGSKFFDLYVYTFCTGEEQRITFGGRIISPVYQLSSNKVVAITSYDGTSNIMISDELDLTKEQLQFKNLTHLDNGIHMFSLSWIDGDLYVDAVYHQGRQIFRVTMESGELIPVATSRWDNRDQEASPIGMIYAKDESGIFNLVIQREKIDQYITNVQGGAFMPSVSSDGRILYSLFENGRYNIAIINNHESIQTELVGYKEDYFMHDDISELILAKEIKSNSYEEKMLSMSIIPKLMIDYNTIKPGFYFLNTEVIDRFSIFGGFSVNRLWDIDAFLMLEYRKYLPTFYTNLFWISRHRDADKNDPYLYPRINGTVNDSIHIFNDLSFNLFSGDIGTRFALGLHKYKIQYNYSNYRQHIEQNLYQFWIYDSLNTLHHYGELGFDYFRGHSISLIYKLDTRKRGYVMNMLPGNGLEINGNISYEWNQFMDGFSVSEEHSTFGANFVPNNTYRLTASAEKHYTLDIEKKIVGTFSMQGGGLSRPNVDDFFHFFGGGLPGIKGYTFYDSTITGPYYFIGSSILRIPLLLEKNYPVAQFNFQNISLGGIFQFGGAFKEGFSEFIKTYKLSAGLECRLYGFSFFSYPTAISYELHKPINEKKEKVKHYITILFDY